MIVKAGFTRTKDSRYLITISFLSALLTPNKGLILRVKFLTKRATKLDFLFLVRVVQARPGPT